MPRFAAKQRVTAQLQHAKAEAMPMLPKSMANRPSVANGESTCIRGLEDELAFLALGEPQLTAPIIAIIGASSEAAPEDTARMPAAAVDATAASKLICGALGSTPPSTRMVADREAGGATESVAHGAV